MTHYYMRVYFEVLVDVDAKTRTEAFKKAPDVPVESEQLIVTKTEIIHAVCPTCLGSFSDRRSIEHIENHGLCPACLDEDLKVEAVE